MADIAAELLAAASELLRADGPGALSVRRVAEAAGCSTMAIYSRFGGKSGLLDALAGDGFERLAAAVESAQANAGGGPRDEIVAMGMAMRETALADPLRYRLMFGPLAEPSVTTREASRRALSGFGQAVARLEIADRAAAAELVYGVCHGLIGAELASVMAPDDGERLSKAIATALAGCAGDSPH